MISGSGEYSINVNVDEYSHISFHSPKNRATFHRIIDDSRGSRVSTDSLYSDHFVANPQQIVAKPNQIPIVSDVYDRLALSFLDLPQYVEHF
jgi:hypothetical protein